MTPEQRDILINREKERALHYLAQSDEMLTLGHWDLAANRQYYACFHAVQALFVSKGISGQTHKGMINQFSLHFVKRGLVSMEQGSFLSRLMQLRQKADYNCYYDVTEAEVKDMSVPTHVFVETIISLIDNR